MRPLAGRAAFEGLVLNPSMRDDFVHFRPSMRDCKDYTCVLYTFQKDLYPRIIYILAIFIGAHYIYYT